jgi:hypothetical protein
MWRTLSSGWWLLGMLIGFPRKRSLNFLSVVSSLTYFVRRFIYKYIMYINININIYIYKKVWKCGIIFE